MNMTFWQKTTHYNAIEMCNLAINDKPNFYSKIFYANTIMPGISSFFKWDNYTIRNTSYGSREYWWLSPRYGIDYGNVMANPFAGNSYAYEALFPDESHREFNLDYAKYNNTSIFGFRPYGEETYTGVNVNYTYTIVVYHKCTTADNRAAYIMLCYAPRRVAKDTLHNQVLKEVVAGIYTTTSGTVYNYGDTTVYPYYTYPKDRWMDVNFGKSEDYILHPLVVNGCVATDLFIIDGGMDALPALETITLANKNYFILNRHIAIKIN